MPQTRADPGGPAGHRHRLRQRAQAAGLAALPDYELLELYLFRTLPRGDVKPLAKALMARFGGLAEVIGAPEGELAQCAGIGAATASDLRLAQELAVRAARAEARRRPVISSWSALIAYVRVSLAQERREQFRVIFLDRKNQLQSDEMLGQGTVDHAPVYPREIMRRALELAPSFANTHYNVGLCLQSANNLSAAPPDPPAPRPWSER